MYAPYQFQKTEAPVKADPFSLDALIAWLRTKPASEAYCYGSTGECLIAQYFTASGVNFDCIGGESYYTGRAFLPLPDHFGIIAQGDIESFGDADRRTFGAALSRALAIKARQ